MSITIPEGFFPPPGVPFETEAQRDVACALHNAGSISVQVRIPWCNWFTPPRLTGNEKPEVYRLAPPKPRTVGPFESDIEYPCGTHKAGQDAVHAARDAGFKRFRIKLTATAEEIL